MKFGTAGVLVSLMALSTFGNACWAQGAVRDFLVKAPSNLTTLAKQNGGVLPFQRLWDAIDGRSHVVIGSHGPREMPVWGYIYRAEDTQPADLYARNRIHSLLDYLARIQENKLALALPHVS